ncbi:MAG: hypothetical protein ACM31C_19925 [Acidobacteriota bacterium]
MEARRVARRVLLASLSAGIVLGCVASLRDHAGHFIAKLIATSFAITFASALVSVSLAAWNTAGGRPWSRAGVTATLAALAAFAIGLWSERDGETFWRLVAVATVVGAGGAHGSLLSLARVAPRHHTVRVLALANLALVVSLICGELWIADPHGALLATIGSLVLLDVVLSLALFVLDHVRRTTLVDPNEAALPTAIARDKT